MRTAGSRENVQGVVCRAIEEEFGVGLYMGGGEGVLAVVLGGHATCLSSERGRVSGGWGGGWPELFLGVPQHAFLFGPFKWCT